MLLAGWLAILVKHLAAAIKAAKMDRHVLISLQHWDAGLPPAALDPGALRPATLRLAARTRMAAFAVFPGR